MMSPSWRPVAGWLWAEVATPPHPAPGSPEAPPAHFLSSSAVGKEAGRLPTQPAWQLPAWGSMWADVC